MVDVKRFQANITFEMDDGQIVELPIPTIAAEDGSSIPLNRVLNVFTGTITKCIEKVRNTARAELYADLTRKAMKYD